VLLPSPQAAVQRALAGQRIPVGNFDASLPPGHSETHERLHVYGFAERGDFDTFKPPAGALSAAQARAYAEALPGKLREIPRRRWTSTVFGYSIESAGPVD